MRGRVRHVEDDIATAVSRRFKVKPVAITDDNWPACDGVSACVAALPPDPQIDAYIVVHPIQTADPAGSDRGATGIGIYQQDVPMGCDYIIMYAMYAAGMYMVEGTKPIPYFN